MIKRIELGNSGEKVSQYVLGAMLMGTLINTEDSYKILDDYVFERGGNFLDTANNYAWWIGRGENSGIESETVLGKWMKDRDVRDKIFLATKAGARQKDHMALRDKSGIPRWNEIPDNFEGASEKVIRKNIEQSLKRLQTTYIDLFYIHADDRNTPLEETLATLNALIEEGSIKHYGYSNIQTWRLEKLFNLCDKHGWIKPVAVQQEYSYINPAKYLKHPYANHTKEDFFDWMNENKGVSLIAYSPLLKGVYGSTTKAEQLLRDPEYDTAKTRNQLKRISEVADMKNLSPNALVLAWMANRKEGIFPILGFSKVDQYMENLSCLDVELSDDLMDELK